MADGNIEDKFYVYLGMARIEAKFLKLTSQVAFYDTRPQLLSGCVEYRARQIHSDLAAPRTLVPTDNLWTIPSAGLVSVLSAEPGRIKCVMPQDFPGRLTAAIRRSKALSEQDRQQLLRIISSAHAPALPSEQPPSASP